MLRQNYSEESEQSAQKMLKSIKNGSIKRHVLECASNYDEFDDPNFLSANLCKFGRILKTKNYSYILDLNTPQSPAL
ncbi:hypothetical protein IKF92_01665 [Candidatus Saccharibacteria bacterium]|nr:hypothetical protein [Candidatus Saccharibacteria bacterium]